MAFPFQRADRIDPSRPPYQDHQAFPMASRIGGAYSWTDARCTGGSRDSCESLSLTAWWSIRPPSMGWERPREVAEPQCWGRGLCGAGVRARLTNRTRFLVERSTRHGTRKESRSSATASRMCCRTICRATDFSMACPNRSSSVAAVQNWVRSESWTPIVAASCIGDVVVCDSDVDRT